MAEPAGGATGPVDGHAVEVELAPDGALRALARAAERWGAEFEPEAGGGRLRLPVVAGIRRGIVDAVARVARHGEGSRVELKVRAEHWQVQTAPVVILLFGAAGGLLGLAWPIFPSLVRLVPAGLLLAFCAWFLVIARLQTSGPADFLDTLVDPDDEPEGSANDG